MPKQDIKDAVNLTRKFEVKNRGIGIDPIVKAFKRQIGITRKDELNKIPLANLVSRIRMVTLYYFANSMNYLVAGTGDRSEDLLGYFTKYGDGGVDMLPISHLYKTQVRALAKRLGVPERIAYKPSSPQLYPGHKATDELPADYEVLDPILVDMFDQKKSPEELKSIGVDPKITRKIIERYEKSQHKRAYATMLKPW
jgi:NAD+ synthase